MFIWNLHAADAARPAGCGPTAASTAYGMEPAEVPGFWGLFCRLAVIPRVAVGALAVAAAAVPAAGALFCNPVNRQAEKGQDDQRDDNCGDIHNIIPL